MQRSMLSFVTLDLMIRDLAATMRGDTAAFMRVVEALIERSGWHSDEFFAVRRGDVIEVDSQQTRLTIEIGERHD
jgi:hypothetical protein